MRTAGLLLVAALLLAGCSQDGDTVAGVRLGPSASATVQAGDAPTPDPSSVATAGLAHCPAADTSPAVDGGLPDVTLPCLGEGPAVRLAGLRGTPLVVNVWASWCEPCRTELPVLAQAARTYGTRVDFLGVDVADSSPDGALALLAASGVRYPSVVDWSARTKAGLRWAGPPMTVLVRPDGTIAWKQAGEITSLDQLTGLVSEHLGVSA